MASYLETSKRSLYSAILVVKERLEKNCFGFAIKRRSLIRKVIDCLSLD